MRTPPRLASLLIACMALVSAGCERTVFGLANRGFAPPESSVVFAPDVGLSLDVYRPQPAAKPAPTLVFFYGGSWQRGERAQYRFVGRQLAQNGVLTIVADYRTWPRAGFPAFVDDAARAVAWSRAHAAAYGGDPARLFVAGHSAGAQIAALVGADARYLGRHGMKPRDLAGVIGLSGPYDFNVNGSYVPIFGPPAQWPLARALNAVDGDEPPFLLVHGTADRVVDLRDSERMAQRLRAAGDRVELLLVPGGHLAPLADLRDLGRAPQLMPAILRFIGAP